MGNTEGRRYEITPRSADLGGGWKLVLLEDGEEAGGGVFPVPADARHACLLAAAYDDAMQEGEAWVANR